MMNYYLSKLNYYNLFANSKNLIPSSLYNSIILRSFILLYLPRYVKPPAIFIFVLQVDLYLEY